MQVCNIEKHSKKPEFITGVLNDHPANTINEIIVRMSELVLNDYTKT